MIFDVLELKYSRNEGWAGFLADSCQRVYPLATKKLNAALDKLVKSPPFQGGDYGFDPRTQYMYDFDTRMVEYLAFNQGIEGSNPSGVTIK